MLLLSDTAVYLLDPFYNPIQVIRINKSNNAQKYVFKQQMKDCVIFMGVEARKIITFENNRIKVTKIPYSNRDSNSDTDSNNYSEEHNLSYEAMQTMAFNFNSKDGSYRPRELNFTALMGGITQVEMSRMNKQSSYKYYKYKLQLLELLKDLRVQLVLRMREQRIDHNQIKDIHLQELNARIEQLQTRKDIYSNTQTVQQRRVFRLAQQSSSQASDVKVEI